MASVVHTYYIQIIIVIVFAPATSDVSDLVPKGSNFQLSVYTTTTSEDSVRWNSVQTTSVFD